MQKLVIPAAIAASLLLPAVANAQALPGAVVAVVDLDRVTRDCNACKTASAALRSQASAIESRAKALGTPLETEAKSIQTALQAAKGSPDAALQARIKSFQEKQQSGSQGNRSPASGIPAQSAVCPATGRGQAWPDLPVCDAKAWRQPDGRSRNDAGDCTVDRSHDRCHHRAERGAAQHFDDRAGDPAAAGPLVAHG